MADKMSTKELQDQITKNMKKWQKIENATVAATGAITEKTDNPIVRLVMEIIQRDSQMHYRVQGYITESLTEKAVTLTPEEIGQVWGMIEDHIKLERKTVELAKKAIDMIGGSKAIRANCVTSVTFVMLK